MFCREDAYDLVSKYREGYFDVFSAYTTTPIKVRPVLFGIVKEVAPAFDANTDDELGVDEFQKKYFDNHPLYLDYQKKFYELLGSRCLIDQDFFTWNPFKMWDRVQKVNKRLKKKKIDGNIAGEGLFQGGIILFNCTERKVVCTFVLLEMTSYELPVEEIKEQLELIKF